MSGETEKQVSGWTVDTAMGHFEQRVNDIHKELDDYKTDIKLRFTEVNEFRKSLDDLGQKMQTKLEAQALQKSNDDKFGEHGKQLSDLRSRLDVGNPAINALQNQQAINKGILQGSDITMGKIYAAIGAAGAILGILVLLANGVFK